MRSIVPKKRTGQFFFFLLESLIFTFVCVAGTRAMAAGSYLWTGATEFAFAVQCAIVSKLGIEDDNSRTVAAYAGGVVGSTIGGLFSLWCTKHWF